MHFRRLVIVYTVLIWLYPSAVKAEFSIRPWLNDSKIFLSQVVEPVAEHFNEQGCNDKTDVYLAALFQALTEIKGTVTPKSYLLFRDSILAAAANLTPWDEQINCSVIDKWVLVESHVRNQLELIGNVLLIIE